MRTWSILLQERPIGRLQCLGKARIETDLNLCTEPPLRGTAMSVLTKQCLLIQVLEPPCVYVDGYHVALEGPREGIRYLNCGTFGHQPFGDTLEGRLEHPCIPEQQVNVRHRAPS